MIYLAIIAVAVASNFFWNKSRIIEIESKNNTELPSEAQEEGLITLIFTGDIMLDRGVEYIIEQHNDWKWPFLKVADFLKSADLTFGNLESIISDKGTKVGSIYSFRADPRTIEGLTFAGFDVLSLANNHAFDYGSEALVDTLVRLKLANIDFIGADLNKQSTFSPLIKEIKDVKIGFLAYTNLGPSSWKATDANPGIAWINENDFSEIQKNIKDAKEEVDILIVSLHAGTEYEPEANQFQKDFSKMAIDAGADLLIGHHPHVVQPYEGYKNGWIFYSLGNFIFDQNFSTETTKGQLVKILIKDEKIEKVIPIDIQMNSSFQPEIIN
ncbi:CapA family protein [Patescibacteria group bacterium]|nr:CapA family protein [Patescibacteria group bacterium]MBU1876755.1 CapA family protein [Patescibacteria group bacterium]